LTRVEWEREKTVLAQTLYDVPDNKLILIADGTYLYHEKSGDNELQRKSFSVQKGRHLAKPFVICTTNGRIVDVYGLYPANQNDATILQTILKTNKDLRKLLKDNDHIVLDRGFRNAINTLQNDFNLKTHMPVCKNPNQKQLTTIEANESRMTTKTRWVVEVVNSKLKNTFRANGKVHRNVTLEHSINDFRIAAALTNKFFNDYTADHNEYIVATKMKSRLNTLNKLDPILAEHNLDRKRKDFAKMNINSIPDFPKLTRNDIIDNITFGTYQIEQAESYIKENFKNTNNSFIELYSDKSQIFDDNTVLLRARIQSRHVNSKQYLTYITYDKTIKNHTAIKDTICTCNTGRRTVGTCAHATSVIYYLSNARFQSAKKTTVNIDSIYNRQISESSDSDSETIINSDYNNDSSDTLIDSDNTIIDESDHGNSPQHMTIYPDISTIASTFE